MGGGSLSKNFPLHSNTMFFSRFFASSVVICSDLVSGGWTGYMPWWVGLYYMFSHFLTFNMLNNCRYFNHFLRGSLIELIIRSLFIDIICVATGCQNLPYRCPRSHCRIPWEHANTVSVQSTTTRTHEVYEYLRKIEKWKEIVLVYLTGTHW